MSDKRRNFSQYMPWLWLLLGMDGFWSVLLWLVDADAFEVLVPVIVLATVILFAALGVVLDFIDKRREKAFLSFLMVPDKYHEELLLETAGSSRQRVVCMLGNILREKQNEYNQAKMQLADYEEYVELWAHEIKIPLSLMTMMLDNRREELPGQVGMKLDYARSRMQESVNQMLFYARLKGTTKDYMFEEVDVRTCIEDVLEDYGPLLEEKQFCVINSIESDTVYTDRRGICFLLGQIISNAVKYAGDEPRMYFEGERLEQTYVLSVRDNGTGVRDCDLPYIFEKGFTGDSGETRKKATGMGLYLAREMAEDLKLTLDAKSSWGEGFEMQISFPEVKKRN